MLNSTLPNGSSLIDKKYHNLRFLIKIKLLEKDMNLSDLARAANIPYMRIYNFMIDTKPSLKLQTFLSILKVLDNLTIEEIRESEL